ncbi:MAG: glycosyl hydrolase family 25 [Prevotella sp.]|nr:glycosyl hydrolase family 25 [Prevotella sp.]
MKSTRSLRRIGALLLLAVSIASAAHIVSGVSSSKPSARRYDGIDVSHHQGRIDWREVARDRNIRFVYIKATQGTTITDGFYRRNIRGARRQGLRCGSYHYLSSATPVRAQFRHFRSVVRKSQQDLIPMIDVEREGVRGWSRRQVQDSVAVFAWLVRRYYGKAPLIYSQVNFYNSHLAPRFNRHFLFLGKYSSVRPAIKGAGRHNIWQFSERGRVRGISGYVDLDRFMSGTSLADIRL